ncbi:hypothetical protein FACS189460_5940 [Deltaproteobacteria bacterium]|nr:hypothetical protein FACS189460_5940 [Deltaproteobacteria bacterium]
MWRERATVFAEHSVERLQANSRELRRLEGYGLTPEAARAARLGWNDRVKVFPGSAWGLNYAEAGQTAEAQIKLYPGLIIPLYEDGQVIKIKIRRPDGSTPRYLCVKGSCMRLSLYGRTDKVMIVESERDAAMLWSRFHHLTGWSFLATGSASARPCPVIRARLEAAAALAVSLDSDRAGYKAWRDWWRREFPLALFWPVPKQWGKDPGEAALAGRDLNAWLWTLERKFGF